MRSICFALMLFISFLIGCKHGEDADEGNPQPHGPPASTCTQKQKGILERSGWNLTQGLEAVIDALLDNRATEEPLPICTES